jgi:hypothetical protein
MVIDYYYVVDKDSEIYRFYYGWVHFKDKVLQARHKYIHNEIMSYEASVYENGPINYLKFEESVEIPKGLKESFKGSGQYVPDRRMKLGKEFYKKFMSYDIGKPDNALDLLKHNNFDALVDGGPGFRTYHPQLWSNKHDVLIAVVPANKDNPYDAVEGLKEITSSIFNKIIEHEIVEI